MMLNRQSPGRDRLARHLLAGMCIGVYIAMVLSQILHWKG